MCQVVPKHTYPNVLAVGGEVDLRDKAGDTLGVPDALQGWPLPQVVEIDVPVLGSDREVAPVRAEPVEGDTGGVPGSGFRVLGCQESGGARGKVTTFWAPSLC